MTLFLGFLHKPLGLRARPAPVILPFMLKFIPLDQPEPSPFETIAGRDDADTLLICDHASPLIPASLAELGLAAGDRYAHVAWDIGAAGANRPRNVYVSNNITTGGALTGVSQINTGAGGYIQWTNRSSMSSPADGQLTLQNWAGTDFGRIQLGGSTASFPAIKRSTTSLQVRLADDSAFTAIQGKLTTDTAYTATPQTCSGYITIYDSTGTPYKVMVST